LPIADGRFSELASDVKVGRALSSTELLVRIETRAFNQPVTSENW
jgi:hypothetical protein